ncbi:MAG: DoxX family protein [Xanthomonadales bacterium]|nr:DoxX family protein [Xanthomonadales bacterium]
MKACKQDSAISLLRVSLGLMFIAHGLLKILVFSLDGSAGFFESVGFPGWLVYPVTFGEIIGGALLVVGWLVRPVTAVLVPVLVGALWAHLPNGWVFSNANGGWEYPAFLLIASIAVLLAGPDRWSLDGRG